MWRFFQSLVYSPFQDGVIFPATSRSIPKPYRGNIFLIEVERLWPPATWSVVPLGHNKCWMSGHTCRRLHRKNGKKKKEKRKAYWSILLHFWFVSVRNTVRQHNPCSKEVIHIVMLPVVSDLYDCYIMSDKLLVLGLDLRLLAVRVCKENCVKTWENKRGWYTEMWVSKGKKKRSHWESTPDSAIICKLQANCMLPVQHEMVESFTYWIALMESI